VKSFLFPYLRFLCELTELPQNYGGRQSDFVR